MNDNQIGQLIRNTIDESCRVKKSAADLLVGDITKAARTVADAIRDGGKVLLCGNGGSAADAQHFAGELVGRYLRERDAWPAVALSTDTSILTAVGNDYGFDRVFERQVHALGKSGDVLIGISTSGNSENVLRAMNAARALSMTNIALTGQGGGKMAAAADILLAAPATLTPRIQETHVTIIHLLCDIIETILTES
jgi:D-sedoheptulose 7-phosphate isomerase